MILTEAQQAALDVLDAEGRACANPAAPCTRRAAMRVAVTLTEGTPRTCLLPMCPIHTRRALNQPIRNGVVAHVARLSEV